MASADERRHGAARADHVDLELAAAAKGGGGRRRVDGKRKGKAPAWQGGGSAANKPPPADPLPSHRRVASEPPQPLAAVPAHRRTASTSSGPSVAPRPQPLPPALGGPAQRSASKDAKPFDKYDKYEKSRNSDERDDHRPDRQPPPKGYTCNRCRVPGHWIEDCKELPTIEVPDGYLCRICGVKGHWIQNCPSAARNGGDGGLGAAAQAKPAINGGGSGSG